MGNIKFTASCSFKVYFNNIHQQRLSAGGRSKQPCCNMKREGRFFLLIVLSYFVQLECKFIYKYAIKKDNS